MTNVIKRFAERDAQVGIALTISSTVLCIFKCETLEGVFLCINIFFQKKGGFIEQIMRMICCWFTVCHCTVLQWL